MAPEADTSTSVPILRASDAPRMIMIQQPLISDENVAVALACMSVFGFARATG